MKPVLVEDDVYQYLAQSTMESGRSPSAILREALGLGAQAPMIGPTLSAAMPSVERSAGAQAKVQVSHELAATLEEPLFKTNSTAVARMLRLLRAAHDQRKGEFAKVLGVQGRNRAYFARSEEEILRSGRSTQPKQIPGTGYWVMTNSPTPQKRDMVREVLEMLGFSTEACKAAAAAIV